MNSPNGAYGGLCTTIGGCSDVLASHVSPAASKTIYDYMHTLYSMISSVSHKVPNAILTLLPYSVLSDGNANRFKEDFKEDKLLFVQDKMIKPFVLDASVQLKNTEFHAFQMPSDRDINNDRVLQHMM